MTYHISRSLSSATVTQPSALLPRSQSVADIRDRAGFSHTTRYPLYHWVNYPFKYYDSGPTRDFYHTRTRYEKTMDFRPSLLRSFYYHSPYHFNYPWFYYRSTYRNWNYNHDPYLKWHNPYYGSLFNYWSPYRDYHYTYSLLY